VTAATRIALLAATALLAAGCHTSRQGGLLHILSRLAASGDGAGAPAFDAACAGRAQATRDPDWVPLEGGSYRMGRDGGDPTRGPAHAVAVAPFDLARTETTHGQYRRCVDAGCCAAPFCDADPGSPADLPATCMDWQRAREFCTWAGGRLPSEAEWEWAARGGGLDRAWPWGDTPATCATAVMGAAGGGCGEGETQPPCSRPGGSGPPGICDLAGNVAEWVEDDWHDTYDDAPADGSPWAADPRGPDRVARGGSWVDADPDLLAAWARSRRPADAARANLGFRCARSRPAPSPAGP
jgi:formylglycine-generating enzyme required for sulfatase activity